MGPGTHVASNVLSHRYPTSYPDAVSLIHDIDYLQAASEQDLEAADTKMLKQLDQSLIGNLGYFGIVARRSFGWDLRSRDPRAISVGNYLKQYIQTNPEWVKALSVYKLNYGK